MLTISLAYCRDYKLLIPEKAWDTSFAKRGYLVVSTNCSGHLFYNRRLMCWMKCMLDYIHPSLWLIGLLFTNHRFSYIPMILKQHLLYGSANINIFLDVQFKYSFQYSINIIWNTYLATIAKYNWNLCL